MHGIVEEEDCFIFYGHRKLKVMYHDFVNDYTNGKTRS
jgi:hypothetical protein